MNIFRRISDALSAKPVQGMELINYVSLGPVNFTDSYDQALKKLQPYNPLETEISMIKRKNKAIYVEDAKLMITFNDNADGILYFEMERGSFIHNGNDVFKMGYKKAKAYAEKLDSNLQINEELDGFDAPGLGFRVSRYLKDSKYTDTLEYILAYSHEYAAYPRMTPDEIIKYYFEEEQEDNNNKQ